MEIFLFQDLWFKKIKLYVQSIIYIYLKLSFKPDNRQILVKI